MIDPMTVGIIMAVLIISVGLHEYGHAKSADAAGDPTPRSQGRVTLNPLAHLDPFGTIFMFIMATTGFGIGWGKPVQSDPRKMHNPKWDFFMSVLWGPLTNLILAVVFATLFRFAAPMQPGPVVLGSGPSGEVTLDILSAFFFFGTYINVALCLFNLIPVGPLDGHWILGILLPERIGARFMMWSKRQGMFVLLGILLIDQIILRPQGQPEILDVLIRRPTSAIVSMLLGIG